jgi:hypothetical protein
MRNDFKPEEITVIKRHDKRSGKTIEKEFPQVGGRLRLFHEEAIENKYQASGIKTEVIRYEGDVAVVQAHSIVNGSVFSGIGMASKSRDKLIYPAILELAETRAIARSLRFAGYGVEYTGAEEMGGMTLSQDDDDNVSNEPEDRIEKPASKEPGVSLKRQVWDFVSSRYEKEDKDTLAQGVKTFVNNTLKKNEGRDKEWVFQAILDQKDAFTRAFEKLIGIEEPPEPDGEPRPHEPSVDRGQEYTKAKEDLVKDKSVSENGNDLATERKLQAQVFMAMPEGTGVGLFNDTIDHLIACNDDKSKSDIYRIILEDIPGFIELMEDFDKREKPEEQDKDEPKKKEYSDFRKKWVNLNWKQFNKFIIKEAKTFKSDREEYDAAREKFDRLKVNNDAAGIDFPYIFGDPEKKEPKLDASRSILETNNTGLKSLEQGSYIAQLKASYPKMYKVVCDTTGYDDTQPYQTDEMKDFFVKTFDAEVKKWETKNQLPYEEN